MLHQDVTASRNIEKRDDTTIEQTFQRIFPREIASYPFVARSRNGFVHLNANEHPSKPSVVSIARRKPCRESLTAW